MRPIREYRGVDRARFEAEIRPLNQPAVLRGLVGDWPAAKAGLDSAGAMAAYLKRFITPAPIDVIRGVPAIEGRFHYDEELRGLNFQRGRAPFAGFVDHLMVEATRDPPDALAMQSASVREHLPGFAEENRLALVDARVVPRIWIGNALRVATHFDLMENIACAVAGRRRFTVFPPEQIPNLYVGPLEFTPAGAPISMVHVTAPDFARYPRFAQALEAAEFAELAPGDALYLPYHWWHHVESLDAFNVLVNYWWSDAMEGIGSPFDAMLHAMLSVRNLPREQRDAWRAVFDHYVFEANGDPVSHLPAHAQGLFGPFTATVAARMKGALRSLLSRT